MTQKFELSGSLGEALQQRRLELELSLTQISRSTGIPKKYLKRLESGNYQGLGHTIYSLGYAKRYASQLGFSQKIVTKKYLLERGPIPHAQQNLKKQRPKSPIVTTKVLLTGAIAVCTLLILGYLFIQLLVLMGRPQLSVYTPADNQTLQGDKVEVRGKTTAGSKVTIDGAEVLVEDDGTFSTSIPLVDGLNDIETVASNSLGRTTTITRNVLVESLEPVDPR